MKFIVTLSMENWYSIAMGGATRNNPSTCVSVSNNHILRVRWLSHRLWVFPLQLIMPNKFPVWQDVDVLPWEKMRILTLHMLTNMFLNMWSLSWLEIVWLCSGITCGFDLHFPDAVWHSKVLFQIFIGHLNIQIQVLAPFFLLLTDCFGYRILLRFILLKLYPVHPSCFSLLFFIIFVLLQLPRWKPFIDWLNLRYDSL